MLTTTNYGLKKPEGTDVVNIDDFNGNADIIDTKLKEINSALPLKAPLDSPGLTGAPTAPTQTPGDNSTKIANTAFVTTAIANKTSVSGNAGTATKLQTPRNIALAGDVTGSANFDGSGNISITTTVADDSHNHIIANVDGLQSALDVIDTHLSERANKGTPTEYDLALSSGYTSVAAKYSKDEFNRVLLTLHDLKKTDGSVLTGGIIGQLPDGFIPSRYFFTSSLSFVDSGGTIQVVTANLLVGINGSISITIKNPSNYSITKCHGQIIFQV